jgi:hypothetical protein
VASSVVEICNLALSHAGAGGPIASLSESSNEARECSLHYASCRDTLLRAHRWNFAQRQQDLADLGTAVDGWAYQYQYPADALEIHHIRAGGYDAARIVWTGETLPALGPSSLGRSLGTAILYPPVPFSIGVTGDGLARTILTDAYQATATYTAAVTIVPLFDPLFADALSFLLASRVTPRLTGKMDAQRANYQLYQSTLTAATTRDANEAAAPPAPEPDWIRARY